MFKSQALAHRPSLASTPLNMFLPADASNRVAIRRALSGTTEGAKLKEPLETPSKDEPQVYLCSKDLETFPVGTHAFFRLGGSEKGNSTLSLFASPRKGGDCWQGEPLKDIGADVQGDAQCELTPLKASCLMSRFASYPIGKYCTLGPNSNTFVGHLARSCGLSEPDPAGWNPGIDGSPPKSGTYAPNPASTAIFGCSEANCGDSANKNFKPVRLGLGEYMGEDGRVRFGPGPKY